MNDKIKKSGKELMQYGCLIDITDTIINNAYVTIRYYIYNAKAYQLIMVNGVFITINELQELPPHILGEKPREEV